MRRAVKFPIEKLLDHSLHGVLLLLQVRSKGTECDKDKKPCFVCKKSTMEDTRLKKISDKSSNSMRNEAELRGQMTDRFQDVTAAINQNKLTNPIPWYHPSCYPSYTAVKRPKSTPSKSPLKKSRKETRQSSEVPKSDQLGLLKGTCIFCRRRRKKFRCKKETFLKISTVAGCESLRERSLRSGNEGLETLMRCGVDLIAKEAEYHRSCRVQFDEETEISTTKQIRIVSAIMLVFPQYVSSSRRR